MTAIHKFNTTTSCNEGDQDNPHIMESWSMTHLIVEEGIIVAYIYEDDTPTFELFVGTEPNLTIDEILNDNDLILHAGMQDFDKEGNLFTYKELFDSKNEKYLGDFDTLEEALNHYNTHKEQVMTHTTPSHNTTSGDTTMTIKLAPSFIWQAYSNTCIGSKVESIVPFDEVLKEAIASHDPSKDWAEGQHMVAFPKEHLHLLSCGVGERTDNPDDYVIRNWRGKVSLFLKRDRALPCASANVIVYTKAAMLADPQLPEREREKIEECNATHYLIALLANAEGVPNSRSPYRLVDCLAGGNKEAEAWSLEDIKNLAKDARDYADKWEVVAD